jgi:hypothetical protein
VPQDAGAGGSVRYGNGAQFSPCSSKLNFGILELYAEPVTVSNAVTVTALGVFGNQPAPGVQSAMALYSDVGGVPSARLTYTGPQAIGGGDNEIPVAAAVTVPAGIYWIAAEYNAPASICTDDSSCSEVDDVGIPLFGSFPAQFASSDGGAPHTLRTVDINYYVVGTP